MRIVIAVMMAMMLVAACSQPVETVPQTTSEEEPADERLVGDWSRAGRVFTLYSDGWFDYRDEDTWDLVDYGWYTVADGDITFTSNIDGVSVTYYDYRIVEDYEGVIGQSAIEVTMSNGAVIYFVEYHR